MKCQSFLKILGIIMAPIGQIFIYILILILGAVLLMCVSPLLPLPEINNLISQPIFSNITSLLIVIVTLLYAIFTGIQVQKIEKQSIILQEEIKVAKQPCIMPEIKSTCVSECSKKIGRRQLTININLENFGDSPALSIFTIGYFELKNISIQNSNIVKMSYIPNYITGIKINGTDKVSIQFEKKEINALIDDLKINYKKNIERIENNPTQRPYRGTNVVVKTYYKNTMGQWFESTIKRAISHLEDINDKNINISIGYETVVPPNPLLDSRWYKIHFISQNFSPSNVRPISEGDVNKILTEYDTEDVYKECQNINLNNLETR